MAMRGRMSEDWVLFLAYKGERVILVGMKGIPPESDGEFDDCIGGG